MNSAHQRWSRWTWLVYPGRKVALPFEPIKLVLASYVRSQWGRAGQMRIVQQLDHYLIQVRIEGPPVHDPAYVTAKAAEFEAFYTRQFGVGTRVVLSEAKMEAGSWQDGRPTEQLILIPRDVFESTRLPVGEGSK